MEFRFVSVNMTNTTSRNAFYRMDISRIPETGIMVLNRNWGKIGSVGQNKRELFEFYEDALAEYSKVLNQKIGRDYVIINQIE